MADSFSVNAATHVLNTSEEIKKKKLIFNHFTINIICNVLDLTLHCNHN